eukprot:s1_g501.t1
MEEGETTEEGARREAFEEANAKIEIKDLLAVYNIPRISQVQLMYRAELPTREFSAGAESLDVGLFTWDEIPWDELAFPSVRAWQSDARRSEGRMTSPSQAVDAFNLQAGFCDQLGSPFTAQVLRVLAEDIDAGGIVRDLLAGFSVEPVAAALALRVAGAFHRRALDDPQSALGGAYGSAGRVQQSDDVLRALLLDDIKQNRPHYEAYLTGPPQTNEVGRSGIMIGGYLSIAEQTGLPLHVYEIGASAGLNLGFDRFFYAFGDETWGDKTSPVSLAPDWHGGVPPLDASLTVEQRAGCDIAPVDIGSQENQRRLESYIWPDQPDRLARLRGAVRIAKELGTHVVQQSADAFVRDALDGPEPNAVRVIAHTIMWQYMPEDMRADIERTIRQAGERATEKSPIAWLRLEPIDVKDPPRLQLNVWPGGATQDLAVAHPHGASAKWL